MPLRFSERDSSNRVSLSLLVLAALSLVLCIVYGIEGAQGPLHNVQAAASTLAAPVRTVSAGIQAASDSAQGAVEDATADPETLNALREQNQQLRQQVSELEEYRVRAQQLQELQGISDLYALDSIACSVASMPSDSWNRVVVVDKGTANGVEIGMAVMGSTGLVGQVVAVSDSSAQVRLLQDASSGVAVLVQSSRAEGLLRGNIDGLLYLEGLGADAAVKVGDTLVTSGLGGGYTRGLVVGTVARIESAHGQALQRIVVAPNASVSALDELLIVKGVGKVPENIDANALKAQGASAANSQSQKAAEAATEEASETSSEAASDDAASAQSETPDATEESLEEAPAVEGEYVQEAVANEEAEGGADDGLQ